MQNSEEQRKLKKAARAAKETAKFAEFLAARLESEDVNYLLFPEEFDSLLGDSLLIKALLAKLEALKQRVIEYKKEQPNTQVHPDTLSETLKTFDRALETGRFLCLQIEKCNKTLHEKASIREQRVRRRRS